MARASAAAIEALSLMPSGSAPRAVIEREHARLRSVASARQLQRPTKQAVEETLLSLAPLRAERDMWRSQLQQAYELFSPQREPFAENPSGTKRGAAALSSVPMLAATRWASRKQKQLIPPSQQFAKYKPGDDIPEGMKELAAEVLNKQTERYYSILGASNFAQASHEALLDASIWTGIITLRYGTGRRPLRWDSVPANQCLIRDMGDGNIDVFREREMSVAQVLRIWPTFDLNDKVAETIRRDPKLTISTKLKIVEGTVYNVGRGDWDYVVIDKTNRELGFHDVFSESTFIVFGVLKLANENYRRGPGLFALPDARTLQRVKELLLRNAAIATAGLWKAKADLGVDAWNIRLSAGAVIPVAEMSDIEPLKSDRNFDIAQLIIGDLETSIFDIFEQSNLGNIEETPVRSAFEILARKQEQAENQFAGDSRLQTELVIPVFRNSAGLLVEAGVLSFRVDGSDVDIELDGPIARAQQTEKLLNFQQAMDVAAPLGAAALMAIKPAKAAQKIFQASGVWPEVINSDSELEAAAQQAGQALEQAAEAGELPNVPGVAA